MDISTPHHLRSRGLDRPLLASGGDDAAAAEVPSAIRLLPPHGNSFHIVVVPYLILPAGDTDHFGSLSPSDFRHRQLVHLHSEQIRVQPAHVADIFGHGAI